MTYSFPRASRRSKPRNATSEQLVEIWRGNGSHAHPLDSSAKESRPGSETLRIQHTQRAFWEVKIAPQENPIRKQKQMNYFNNLIYNHFQSVSGSCWRACIASFMTQCDHHLPTRVTRWLYVFSFVWMSGGMSGTFFFICFAPLWSASSMIMFFIKLPLA